MTITLTLEEVQAHQKKVEEHIQRISEYYRKRHIEIQSIYVRGLTGGEDARKECIEEYKSLLPFVVLENPPKLIPSV